MSNYIMSRKSLKQHCEAMCERFECVPTSGAYGEHKLVLELLEQTEWIPVSERLPEEYGEYLITWTTSQSKRPFIGISEGEVTSEYDHEHNRFKFKWLLEDYVKNYPDVEVIAWMPLPAPYKAEREE